MIRNWNRFWFTPLPARDLAVGRALFCLGVFALFFDRPLALWAQVGPMFENPIKVLGLVSFRPLPPGWLDTAVLIWRISLLTAAIGLATRISLWTTFILGFYLLALPNHFGRLEHTDGVLVFLLGTLALSRCGDAWSVDAWLKNRSRRGERVEASTQHDRYRWPIRMAQVVLCCVFFAAGLSKIINGGWTWVTSDTLSIILIKA